VLEIPRFGNHFEALDVIRQGVRERFGGYAEGVATVLTLRHVHGSQFMSRHYQAELDFLDLSGSPAYVRKPQGNGVAERFIRTLKEQLLWVERFATVADLLEALHAFKGPLQQDLAGPAEPPPHVGGSAGRSEREHRGRGMSVAMFLTKPAPTSSLTGVQVSREPAALHWPGTDGVGRERFMVESGEDRLVPIGSASPWETSATSQGSDEKGSVSAILSSTCVQCNLEVGNI
jgi:hypothetical protein